MRIRRALGNDWVGTALWLLISAAIICGIWWWSDRNHDRCEARGGHWVDARNWHMGVCLAPGSVLLP